MISARTAIEMARRERGIARPVALKTRPLSGFPDAMVDPTGLDNMGKETVYTRLADMQELSYKTPPGIDRRTLPNHNLRPNISTYSFDGKPRVSVMWDMGNGGSTSQSPAAAWGNFGSMDIPWPDVLRRLFEALELPGSVSDYHTAIWRTFDALWDRRRQDPDILPELERLCLLDLKLMEFLPEMARVSPDHMPQMVHVPATRHLIRLYEREGFVAEALEIARRGVALGQEPAEAQRLEARLRDLEAEDAA